MLRIILNPFELFTDLSTVHISRSNSFDFSAQNLSFVTEEIHHRKIAAQILNFKRGKNHIIKQQVLTLKTKRRKYNYTKIKTPKVSETLTLTKNKIKF